MINYKLSRFEKALVDSYWKKLSKPKAQQGFVTRKIVKHLLKKNPDIFRYISNQYFGFSVGKQTYRYEQFFHNGSYQSLKSIGNFCSIGDNVLITKGDHPMHYVSTNPFLYERKHGSYIKEDLDISSQIPSSDVVIGHDVWIGANTTILSGVTINNGAIIGAGAVVTKDVPAFSIVVGIPAKIIRYRFEQEMIEKIQHSEWWLWSKKDIQKNITNFYNPQLFLKNVKHHE